MSLVFLKNKKFDSGINALLSSKIYSEKNVPTKLNILFDFKFIIIKPIV
ncbi:hypothetical protein PQY72_01440 [Pelagibacteraceae bacterium]|nr:hypothetical protein [Pelagibacteraceae bacterium]